VRAANATDAANAEPAAKRGKESFMDEEYPIWTDLRNLRSQLGHADSSRLPGWRTGGSANLTTQPEYSDAQGEDRDGGEDLDGLHGVGFLARLDLAEAV
jgi:hypothetical protein